ncbi:hypothetical protein BGX34_002730 [Mortierella sp. NVP85]|nr:hypothetical protein BGX34_002730 [Mortierella sp. NVP85]
MIAPRVAMWVAALLVIHLNPTSSSSYHALASPLNSHDGVNSVAQGSGVPSAEDLAGIHLLLENDLDSETPKYPVILLSKPRLYKDGQTACSSIGETLVDAAFGNLAKLLLDTPVAQAEIKSLTHFWVSNNSPVCEAFDRKTGHAVQVSCAIKLPSLCTNSAPRTIIGENDRSKQIKVQTRRIGTWQGYRDRDQFRFLGIPYAQPPVGNLRFKAPKDIDPKQFYGNTTGANTKAEEKINMATNFGNVCMQLEIPGTNKTRLARILGADQSEDCLHLNVFTPSLKAKGVKGLPVMVYVHGGAFTSYSGSMIAAEPGNLVSRAGVVVVTLNYRLSIFGFFENAPAISRSAAPGNLAIRDQIAALWWVRKNIEAFGGDPSQVTIFGESAGAFSMRALLSVPSAFGLYHNVISQSDLMGIPFSSVTYTSALGNMMMELLGCEPANLACAQSKTTYEVLVAQNKAMAHVLTNDATTWVPHPTVYRPVVDGNLIPADFANLIQSGRYNTKVNILWGTTRDEGAFFVPAYYPSPIPPQDTQLVLSTMMRDNRTHALLQSPYYKMNESDPDTVRSVFSDMYTDFYFGCALQVMSRGIVTHNVKTKSKNTPNLYTYKMNHGRMWEAAGFPTNFCKNRACHGDDIIPSFGSGAVLPGESQTGDDARFSRQVVDRFSTFAKTGNPNPDPKRSQSNSAAQNPDVMNVKWSAYTMSNPLLEVNLKDSTVEQNLDTPRCNWIANNVPFEYQVHGPTGKFVPIYPRPA